jgi:hypothetical protein
MRRLNLRKIYVDSVFKTEKFFLARRHEFEPSEILLLQTLKQEEGRVIKRIKGFMIFDTLTEDSERESEQLYGTLWKYVILPKRMVRFNLESRFNLSDVLGDERARRYDGQSEVVKLEKEDELLVQNRISQFLT